MEILIFMFTLFAAVFLEAWADSSSINLPGFGNIFATAFIGSIILYAVRHKK